MKFWTIFHVVAKVARPILSLVGVKPKTAAGKIAEGLEVVDQAISEGEKKKRSTSP